MADGGEGSMSFLMTPPVTSRPAVDRPTVDKGNGQYEETQYSDGKVGIVNTSLFVFHQGFLTWRNCMLATDQQLQHDQMIKEGHTLHHRFFCVLHDVAAEGEKGWTMAFFLWTDQLHKLKKIQVGLLLT